MHTPAGKECKYFYGDYYRGRDHEECRLLNAANPPLLWQRELCMTCPVPEIQLANSCPNMDLQPEIYRPFPFLKTQVRVRTVCSKTGLRDFDPHTGCGQCHPIPPEFLGEKR